MNLRNVYLTTLIPEIPKIINDNNQEIERCLNIIYDEDRGVIVVPIDTTGRIKASSGEFINIVVDNLTVKKQYTNLYENVTTIDSDYYYSWLESADDVRDASIIGSLENNAFKYIDVIKPYYKIRNDVSTAFNAQSLGQEFQILYDTSVVSESPYVILLDPSINGSYEVLYINYTDASNGTWVKLIAVEDSSSWGTTWVVKQYGGTITKLMV